MALSVRTKELVDSFNPYFHMYHMPLRQDYRDPQYADPEVIKNDLDCLKFDAMKLLDNNDNLVVLDFGIRQVYEAFMSAIEKGGYTYGKHLKSSLYLWLGEKLALRPSSKVFAM